MIFDQIRYRESYKHLENAIQRCFDYVEKEALIDREKGSYEIDGRDIFVNIVGYETASAEEKIWEAHRDYLDMHVMLDGEETILLNCIDNMEKGSFEAASDYLPLEGEATASVICRPMDFLICYPEDGHKPGVFVNNTSKTIKKAIFKIKIK